MPKVKLNGKEIEVKPGTMLIDAFKQAGEDIAHYCYHPGLPTAGVCRLCMVEIEGNPRMQIACNTVVTEGMSARNNSDKVKEAVRWGLNFHLINHPLDCPICDQAGECGLQDQYMKFGKYTPEMSEQKVKKRKVVSLGERVVLDSERCILCSRCVRFTSEITKTNELGIFNRGDHAEIGTFEDKPLNNNYSMNTVDICPVGALTSKDFRFRQRVWYLKDASSICTGCSTGCKIRVYYNEEGLFRIKPEHNPEVNGYWMCDKGRDIYKHVNPEARLQEARWGQVGNWQVKDIAEALREAGEAIRASVRDSHHSKVALVLTGQQTLEELTAAVKFFLSDLNSRDIYHWINNPEEMEKFDGLLFRGDRNPNTKGLLSLLASEKVSATWAQLEGKLNSHEIETLMVVGPEDPGVFPDLAEKLKLFAKAKRLVWLSSARVAAVDQVTTATWQIPLKSFFEKDGTLVNAQGRKQTLRKIATLIPAAVSVDQAVAVMSGREKAVPMGKFELNWKKTNFFVGERGSL